MIRILRAIGRPVRNELFEFTSTGHENTGRTEKGRQAHGLKSSIKLNQEKGENPITMKMFEFQFRWGGKRACFGIDVNAPTIEEAISKANRFLLSDATVSPLNHPDTWIRREHP